MTHIKYAGRQYGTERMKFIGITGGVGAGKSAILAYLRQKEHMRVMLADEIAHDLMEPGTTCYQRLEERFRNTDIFLPDGGFDREKTAKFIFGNEDNRLAFNEIVHPAVKEYVIGQYENEKKSGKLQFLFLEAALLIEEHYDAICDELWYIYTDEANRRKRLAASRGYSDEKIDRIFESQLSEEAYRSVCKAVIDNNGTVEQSLEQIEEHLRRIRNE